MTTEPTTHRGHEMAEAEFAAALATGRLHHAWLVTGPRGIGKRALADHLVLRLLGPAAGPLVAAGSHPDLRVLAPPAEGRASGTIPVDEVRALRPFLHAHPSLAAFRVVVFDTADDLARPAANALLKELEEPAPRTVMLLLSHVPGRLPATIRSRCRRLHLPPRPAEEVERLLAQARPDLPDTARRTLARLARGAPGLALELAEARAHELVAALGTEPPEVVARRFAQADERWRLLLEIVPRLVADLARRRADPALAERWAEAQDLAASALRLNLPPLPTALALARLATPPEAHPHP
ncbi:MAG: DNA polymerase III subunit delta' [Sphingomonadaceae bacterium]|uniref:DNA polymerase III subunit delta' n=1 Tax=Thermaurantiacus sp. TaxID=2820283 RepID=UPI00298EF43F|nr:DNA polymerase III subunit delta' [Thermaurantiacus sp.]MCS6985829.1 DNA polymerase III subunit delta' [Sphingomonadaceae bacterium]MDW8413902.1 DNA polymerase III subunit delta' [Thermaurantiacus sp.]